MSKGLLCRLWACLARACKPEPPFEPGHDGKYYGRTNAGLPHVVVKFRDDFIIDYAEGQEGSVGKVWEEIAAGRNLRLRPLYRGTPVEAFRKLIEEAKKRDPGYRPPDLLKFFQITGPERTDWDAIAARLNCRGAGSPVEFAEVERPGPDPGLVNYLPEPLHSQQAYLQNATTGMRLKSVWDANVPGSDGSGIRFVDIEQGWRLNHADLPAPNIPEVPWPVPGGTTGLNYVPGRQHGTAVLGMLVMQPNGQGGVGIAPRATGYVVSCVDLPASTPAPPAPPVPINHAAAITAATEHLLRLRAQRDIPEGEVLVIQRQVQVTDLGDPPRVKWGPVELVDCNFWAIRTAVAYGITVVEAGGNGDGPQGGLPPPINFDLWPANPLVSPKVPYTPRDPTTNYVPKDSGAILVSASGSGWTGPTPSPYGPIGKRIDCFALGTWQITAWTNANGATDEYTTTTLPNVFGYTSAATAAVAGAAIVLQAMAKVSTQARPLTPQQVRKALSSTAWNTPCGTYPIGTMPNLANLVAPLNASTLHGFNPGPLPLWP